MFLITATLTSSLPMSLIKNKFHFQTLTWNYRGISFLFVSMLNQLTCISIFTILLHTQNIQRNLLFTTKLRDWVAYSQNKKILINMFVKWNYGSHRGDNCKKLKETNTSKVKTSVQKGSYKKKVEKDVPLVVIYQQLLKSIGNIIYGNLYLLYMNKELIHLFTPGPIVSSEVLGRKVVTWLDLSCIQLKRQYVLWIVKDHVGCQICAYVNETDSFTSKVTIQKLTKLIIDLTAWRNAWFIFLLATNVESNI